MRMQRLIVIFLIGLFLFGCAGIGQRQSLVEDIGSDQKVRMLRKRAEEFWTAFIDKNYDRVYEIYDPFFRARVPKKQFLANMGRILYHEFEIKNIKVEGNVAKVKTRVVYSVPGVRFKKKVFKVSKKSAEFEDTWLYIYDNWYKEYILHAVNVRFTYY